MRKQKKQVRDIGGEDPDLEGSGGPQLLPATMMGIVKWR
jgi:hypothetical protein